MIEIMQFLKLIMFAVSVMGTIANALQKRWGFVCWIISNLFFAVYNLYRAEYTQAALWLFNTALAVVGLIVWRRKNGKTK